MIPHAPEEHVAVPFTVLHVLPQVPQFIVLVSTLVSHPLEALPSQLAKPAAQVGTQTPDVQVVEPLALVQAFGQLPQ